MRDRHTEVDSLLREVERRYLDDGARSHADRMGLRADLARVREFLADEELAPQSARGLAIFCSTAAGIFEVVRLPRPVEPAAVVAARPFIEPLAELAAPERWCVLLISRRASRIFSGTRERLTEVADVLDDVHRRHAQGGWAQARYQRGIEHEVDEHVRGTCALLFERFKKRPCERLLIAGPSELHHRVEHELHHDLRDRLTGHFEIDVERATAEEVHRRALPLIEAFETSREREALDQLREDLAPSDHAAAGLDEVLELLSERRVRTLLVAHDLHASGFECPRCGRVSATLGTCPLDGTPLEPCEDIIERAIETALAPDAEVIVVRHHQDELAAHGSLAALLRY